MKGIGLMKTKNRMARLLPKRTQDWLGAGWAKDSRLHGLQQPDCGFLSHVLFVYGTFLSMNTKKWFISEYQLGIHAEFQKSSLKFRLNSRLN